MPTLPSHHAYGAAGFDLAPFVGGVSGTSLFVVHKNAMAATTDPDDPHEWYAAASEPNIITVPTAPYPFLDLYLLGSFSGAMDATPFSTGAAVRAYGFTPIDPKYDINAASGVDATNFPLPSFVIGGETVYGYWIPLLSVASGVPTDQFSGVADEMKDAAVRYAIATRSTATSARPITYFTGGCRYIAVPVATAAAGTNLAAALILGRFTSTP